MKPVLQTPTRTLARCLVCGSSEVRSDEVVDRGLVFLAECPRCEHRWTSSVPLEAPERLPAVERMPAGTPREVASAA
jgi:uncharacterized Zn finger protein